METIHCPKRELDLLLFLAEDARTSEGRVDY